LALTVIQPLIALIIGLQAAVAVSSLAALVQTVSPLATLVEICCQLRIQFIYLKHYCLFEASQEE
jgi:hypothetical protein